MHTNMLTIKLTFQKIKINTTVLKLKSYFNNIYSNCTIYVLLCQHTQHYCSPLRLVCFTNLFDALSDTPSTRLPVHHMQLVQLSNNTIEHSTFKRHLLLGRATSDPLNVYAIVILNDFKKQIKEIELYFICAYKCFPHFYDLADC